MDASHDPYNRANYSFRKADYAQWHRMQSKQHILRSQLGFINPTQTRPKVCEGCTHYHGMAYGYTRVTRTMLICGFHPYGWQGEDSCPDWQGAQCPLAVEG